MIPPRATPAAHGGGRDLNRRLTKSFRTCWPSRFVFCTGRCRTIRPKTHLSLSETEFGWQVKPNRAMFLSYERSLQPDLVGAGIIVPIAVLVGSRDPGPSASD